MMSAALRSTRKTRKTQGEGLDDEDMGFRGYVEDIEESSNKDSCEYVGDKKDDVDEGESDDDEGVQQERD